MGLLDRSSWTSTKKVMHDPSGISRGSGFVAFSTSEEASRALSEMNAKMIVSKPLYVALAQHKEERRERLQAQFSQMRPVAMAPSMMAPRMPMYPPGVPGIGQRLFYGQALPAMIPQQGGFGYQQQLVPGMRPGGGPILCQTFLFQLSNKASALVGGVEVVLCNKISSLFQ